MSLPYPAEELLGRVLRGIPAIRKNDSRGIPRWSRVAGMCGTGSHSGYEICRHYDLDPDEKVARK